MRNEHFEQIARVIRAGNETMMSGIGLGRDESAARIKKLKATNAKQLDALKVVRDWRGLDGDGISDPIRLQVIQAIEEG